MTAYSTPDVQQEENWVHPIQDDVGDKEPLASPPLGV